MLSSTEITTQEGDVIRLSVSTINSDIFPDDVQLSLCGVEVLEIVLKREKGSNILSLFSLMQIAEILGGIMSDNDNVILYFYCDDMHDMKRRDTNILPQQFRSLLFSRMYYRYIQSNGITDIINVPVILKSDHDVYIHLITKERHIQTANALKTFLSDLSIK